MNTLPNELQTQIASYLPLPSLVAYRLTSTRHAAIGYPYIFGTYFLSATGDTPERRAFFLSHASKVHALTLTDSKPRGQVTPYGPIFEKCLRDFSNAGSKIASIQLELGPFCVYAPRYMAFLALGRFEAQYLERVRIEFGAEHDQEMWPCRRMWKSEIMKRFVRRCSALKVLELKFPEKWERDTALGKLVPLERTGLKELGLEHFLLDEEELMEFIGANKETLELLRFERVGFSCGGSWESVFNRVKTIKGLKICVKP
jgi:hypothetical protein